jgi:hypothetical protein
MIKVTSTLLILLGSFMVFLLTPYIPYTVLKMTVGNTLSAAAMLCLVLYALAKDRLLGLASFLAVAALFLEQRRRTVDKVSAAMDPRAKPAFNVDQLNVPARDLVPGEVHPPRKDAEVEDYSFEPSEEAGTNKYEKTDDTYDDKHPSDTVPPQPNEVSEFLQLKGLANITSA